MATSLANLRSAAETAPAQRTILDYLAAPKVEKGIAAVAGKHFTADRFLRLAVNAVRKTPLLLQCDPQSVLGAFMASAALGLEPNTIQQQAFLIPYKKRALVHGKWVDTYECQFQVGYRGFVTLAHRSPVIASLEAEAIHAGDLFDHMKGSDAFLKYRKALKDRGELIGAYCFTKLESGVELATVLPLDEILKIRSKSETFNALTRAVEQAENDKDRAKAERKLAETPWVMWEDDMAAKSAIKKHAKQLPLTPGDQISAAAELDSAADVNTIDMASMADPDVARGVVEDGYAPPALPDDPTERASFRFPAEDREKAAAPREGARAPQPAAGHPAARAAGEPEEVSFADQVTRAMQAARTLDKLDIAADQLRDQAQSPEDDALLAQAYQQRRASLEGEPQGDTGQPKPAGRRPSSAINDIE
jgi:recombinase, phage RecT family